MSAALAGCNGESGSGIENSGVNPPSNPGKPPATADCKVSYQVGNGTGSPPKSQVIKEQEIKAGTNTINLPDDEGLTAPEGAETAVFVGWNDGILTYPKGYTYTVTKDVTFNARWAFTTLEDIKACLDANNAPVVIAVADADSPDESGITWQNLLSAIEDANKAVELDMSESTLALFDGSDSEKKFNYKDGNEGAYNSGEKYIKKLVLPSAATSIDPEKVFKDGPFLSLEAVSGLNVSDIADRAFSNISTLAAIIFPSAVRIGDSAFVNCASLTSVSLPAAKTIISFAFENCASLTSVSLPAATSINYAAFYSCGSLTSVSLPAAETFGDLAFAGCVNLTELSLPAVKTIGKYAFSNCINLTEVSLLAVETIGDFAFQYCASLTEVILPEVGTIGASAFANCGKLTSVSLPKAETIIGASAFQYCTKLTVITIAENCTINDTTIHGNFQTYYNSDNGYDTKAAGVYTYSSGSSGISSWSYAPKQTP